MQLPGNVWMQHRAWVCLSTEKDLRPSPFQKKKKRENFTEVDGKNYSPIKKKTPTNQPTHPPHPPPHTQTSLAMVHISLTSKQNTKPSTWGVLPHSSSVDMNACSLPSVVLAMLHTTLEEAQAWVEGQQHKTYLIFRKWVLEHRVSKDKPEEARQKRTVSWRSSGHTLPLLLNTEKHRAAGASVAHSDELWFETGGWPSFWSLPSEEGLTAFPAAAFSEH